MSDTSSASGNGAAQSVVTAQEANSPEATAKIVMQVKEARAREAMMKGNPALAAVFKGKPAEAAKQPTAAAVTEAVEASKDKAAEQSASAAPAAPAAADEPVAESAPADDAKAKEAADAAARRQKRAQELRDLAEAGRNKWQDTVAQKRARDAEAKAKQDLDAERKALQEERARLEAAVKDPYKFLEERGLPPEELARRVVDRGDPTKQVRALREEMDALRKQLADSKEAEKRQADEFAKQRDQQQRAEALRQADASFVKLATNQTTYPSLNSLYSPQEILLKAKQAAQEALAARPGVFYEDSEIADYLENEAKAKLDKLRGPSAAAQKVSETPSEQVAQSEQGQKPRTLTSQLQSERSGDPKSFKKLSRAQQNAALGQELVSFFASKRK